MASTFSTRAWTVLLAISLLVLPACGGGGGSSPSSPSTPTTPAQASITVQAGTPLVSFSSRPGFQFRVTVTTTITESAGLGGNINFVRMQFIANGAVIEIQEISSSDLTVATGTNRLEANTTRNIELAFDNNAGAATSALLVYDFTDDRRNRLQADFTITF